jgi:hypothetical protein
MMPTTDQHLKQFRLNQLALAEVIQPDWKVTIRFYMALHLIEAVFAQQHLHPQSHQERGHLVREKRFGLSFFARSAYEDLVDSAHLVRYMCPLPVTVEKLDQASLEWLDDIYNDVQKLLAT